MRNSPALDALFPSIRQGVLAATFLQPERWWYLSELATYLRTSPSSLQRELKSLVSSGLLQQRRDGARTYFKAQTRSPIFPDLQRLLEKTSGVAALLQSALHTFKDRIEVAFVYGSMARNDEHALSDVDLMVIGSVGLSDLTPVLSEVEHRLGREVNVTNYSTAEFKHALATANHFLETVIREPKEFVKGDQSALEGITRKSRSTAAHHLQTRVGKPAQTRQPRPR
jgi:predicted nucleotidyltransferase